MAIYWLLPALFHGSLLTQHFHMYVPRESEPSRQPATYIHIAMSKKQEIITLVKKMQTYLVMYMIIQYNYYMHIFKGCV